MLVEKEMSISQQTYFSYGLIYSACVMLNGHTFNIYIK